MADSAHYRTPELAALCKTDDLDAVLASLDCSSPTLAQRLQELLAAKGLKRSKVIAAAGINATFGYQIFMGQRHASRDKLLALCLTMGLTFEEANSLLRSGGVNELYEFNRRDAIIIFGLSHGYGFQRVQEELYRHAEPTLD